MWINEYNKDNVYRWIVEEKETKEVVGTIDVVKASIQDLRAEIGYCYSPKVWGKGIGTEALTNVIKFLFDEVNFDMITAKHDVENVGSGKVMQKSGMKYMTKLEKFAIDKTGKRCDLDMYYLLRDEYNGK